MPTIVSNEKGFAFVHVPKTGGTSFGRQIASQTAHDPEFYEGILKDPELGAFYRDHLTLPMYAKHYPQTLQKLRDYTAYAIIRDPYARFKSAFAQLSWAAWPKYPAYFFGKASSAQKFRLIYRWVVDLCRFRTRAISPTGTFACHQSSISRRSFRFSCV